MTGAYRADVGEDVLARLMADPRCGSRECDPLGFCCGSGREVGIAVASSPPPMGLKVVNGRA